MKEKTANPEFQLSITDLNSLSKVKDVDKRNEILSEATDSKNLKWKVEQAMKDEVIEKNLSALAALLDNAGIALANDVSPSDLYGNKWDTVKAFYLADDTPTALFEEIDAGKPDDLSGLMYVVHYNYLKIIRKHKTEKRQLTEREIEEKRVKKSRKEIKALYKQMHAEMESFVRALINEHLSRPDDPSLLLGPLWNVLLEKGIYVSASSIISVMTGKEAYQLPDSERNAAYERAYALPLYQQMMAVAVKGCYDLELMDHNGHYSDSPATIFLTLYSCLNSLGFSFANDEYEQVMDGTHELYEPWEDPIKEATAIDDDMTMRRDNDTAFDDDSENSCDNDAAFDDDMANGCDSDTENGCDEDYIEALIEEYEDKISADAGSEDSDISDKGSWEPMPDSMDGFVEIVDPSEVPFNDAETDPTFEEYPTVYSTEGGFASANASSEHLLEADEAA